MTYEELFLMIDIRHYGSNQTGTMRSKSCFSRMEKLEIDVLVAGAVFVALCISVFPIVWVINESLPARIRIALRYVRCRTLAGHLDGDVNKLHSNASKAERQTYSLRYQRKESVMRLLPIIAALSVISTAAFAQNMDTSNQGNPNRPGQGMGMGMSSKADMSRHKMTRHEKMMHKKMMKKKMDNM